LGSIRCNLNEIQNLVKIEYFPELLFRKILETGSTRTYKNEHELYYKFDEDHEYVVLLCVRRIFTELLTEIRKSEVEKKTHDYKIQQVSFVAEIKTDISLPKFPNSSSEKFRQTCAK
jgi:hypothetical protein